MKQNFSSNPSLFYVLLRKQKECPMKIAEKEKLLNPRTEHFEESNAVE